ncbi:hypothetical protein [Halomonas sp. BC2]|uniref:hypothetical protein n=1 Tax=Halomonas sp. BC2 TaxID=1670449 RepID=UPI0009BDD20D|nr:hypothetical protein [Halomonas sp. BC2]
MKAQGERLYIGWDVGGWNCDHNPASRDALVVLDAPQQVAWPPAEMPTAEGWIFVPDDALKG